MTNNFKAMSAVLAYDPKLDLTNTNRRGETALDVAKLFGSQDVKEMMDNPKISFRPNDTKVGENNATKETTPQKKV